MKEITIGSSGRFLCRAELADNLWTRGWGLLGQKHLPEDRGLWIRRCKSVHTLFMRFPIDLVYLSADGIVVKTCSGVQPFRFSMGGKQAHSTLELPAGFLVRRPITVGEKLVVGPVGYRTSESPDEESDDTPEPVFPGPNYGPLRWRRWLRRGTGASEAGKAAQNASSEEKNRPPGKRFSISVLSIDDTEFPEVEALFSVAQHGRPAGQIDPLQLKIQEGGAPAYLSSLQRVVDPDMPIGLVIAINIGWLTDGVSFGKAREFATNLIDKLGPNDTAAVLVFGGEQTVHQGFTADKAKLKQAVASLGPGRKTGLPDIVAEILPVALDSEQRRLAVVMVMDSSQMPIRSKRRRKKSLRLADQSHCPFIVVGIGPEIERAQDAYSYLTGLTNPYGGQLLEDVEVSQAEAVYTSLEERLRSKYLANILASSPTIVHERSLQLSLGKGSSSGSSTVNYLTKRIELWKAGFLAENQSQRRHEFVQVLFPCPQFVFPLAFPFIMFGKGVAMGIALGMRRTLQLLRLSWRGTLQLLRLSWRGTIQLLRLSGHGAFRTLKQLYARRPRRVVTVPDEDDNQMELETLDNGLSNNANPDHAPDLAHEGAIRSQATVLVTSLLDEDRSYQVNGEPVTIGSGPHCDIKLLAAPGVLPEHARMWWRDGRLMLHHLAPSQVTIVSGKHILWTALNDGDEAAIGPYLLRIALQREEYQQGDGKAPADEKQHDAYSGIALLRAG